MKRVVADRDDRKTGASEGLKDQAVADGVAGVAEPEVPITGNSSQKTGMIDVKIAPLSSILAVVAAVGFYSFIINIPANVMPAPMKNSETAEHVRTILPQGWAFFTKSPRSDTVAVYRRVDQSNYRQLTRYPLSEPENAFGLNRVGRSQGTEYAALLADVGSSITWTDCSDIMSCTDPSRNPVARVTNRAASPTLCGTIDFVEFAATPWVWKKRYDLPARDPRRSVRVDVSC